MPGVPGLGSVKRTPWVSLLSWKPWEIGPSQVRKSASVCVMDLPLKLWNYGIELDRNEALLSQVDNQPPGSLFEFRLGSHPKRFRSYSW